MPSPGADAHDACCRPRSPAAACPVCGRRGRVVGKETLDHQLAASVRARLAEAAHFCANPACAVVYFDGEAAILKGETLRAVTQKDPGDDVPVCYCFGHTRGELRRELAATGRTGIPAEVKRKVEEGLCDCERMNPQGTCCLGNLAEAVRRIQAEAA
ncbi:MAG: hypothetical protein KGL53_06075 [Elusimicrobia bacterium]|nr:hypothetical protein [Elusimicrobiota bacterium]